MYIKEKSTLEVWKKALEKIKNQGKDFADEDKRICRELNNFYMEISEPEKDITKPIEILHSFKRWFYPPLNEISTIMLTKKSHLYSYATGPRLFSFHDKKNQIDDFIIPLLKKNPSSRRAVGIFWDPLIDAETTKKDIPAMITIDFKIKENKLNVSAMIRSNDVFFGWPAAVYQLHTLQKYIAEKLDIKTGIIGVFSTSAHIFKDKFNSIELVLSDKYKNNK